MVIRKGLLLSGLFSIAIVPPMQATPALPSAPMLPATQCYQQALSFGATDIERDRAAYLCEGAIDSSPAQCYWNALSFGSTDRIKNRAARLCRNATSTQPAQCYWNSVGYGATRSMQRQAVRYCRTTDRIIIIPQFPTEPRIDLNPLLR